jgi:hypothetical protein
VSLLIQKSAPKTFPLPIQKSAAKLRRYRFRNWQPTVPLPIQNSAAKNCVAADSEISSEKLCRC